MNDYLAAASAGAYKCAPDVRSSNTLANIYVLARRICPQQLISGVGRQRVQYIVTVWDGPSKRYSRNKNKRAKSGFSTFQD